MDCLVRWFLILLKFDFIVVVKKGITHQRTYHLPQLLHGESLSGIFDNLSNAYMFNIETMHKTKKEDDKEKEPKV